MSKPKQKNIIPSKQITTEESEIPSVVSTIDWTVYREDIRKKYDAVTRIKKFINDEWLTTFPSFSVVQTVMLQPPTSKDPTKPSCPGILVKLFAIDNNAENIKKRKDVVHKLNDVFPTEFGCMKFANIVVTEEPGFDL
jgi:hypothetical protein